MGLTLDDEHFCMTCVTLLPITTFCHLRSSLFSDFLKELCHIPNWLDKQKGKRFTFASLSHPRFVNKLKVALLFLVQIHVNRIYKFSFQQTHTVINLDS